MSVFVQFCNISVNTDEDWHLRTWKRPAPEKPDALLSVRRKCLVSPPRNVVCS